MTSNEALKPCPFCKSHDVRKIGTGRNPFARCSNCGAEALLRIWNTRSTDTPVCASTEEARLRETLPSVLADKVQETLGELEGYTPPETPQDWACVGAAQTIRALCTLLTGDAASQAPETIDRLREALEPFAAFAGKFSDCVVEICEPHSENPSPHIAPFLTKHFDAAHAALSSIPEPLVMPLEGE